MILNVSDRVHARVPRRTTTPLLAQHVTTGWTCYYRRADGGAGTFVTGADTEELARQRAFAWLGMLRREREYDQTLMCEWDCDRAAGVMMRLCGRERHYATCGEHMRETFQRFVTFYNEGGHWCPGCGQPYRHVKNWEDYIPYLHIPFAHHCHVVTLPATDRLKG